mmetsp:Transcript_24132/g.50273  ORF Transcript_24132/g.50273 Transcript_24132/m.50273 type:complete len:197 (-) Transcript_24132:187-777(-)
MRAFIGLPLLLIAYLSSHGCHGFAPTKSPLAMARSSNTLFSSESRADQSQQLPANLVNQHAFVTAIDILKRDMGIEPIPEEERPPLYAIGKLVAELPLELVSGVRLADCETLTLISGLKQSVIDATGMQSLDTIVAIRAGPDDGGGYGYVGDVSEANLSTTAEVYTQAINYAVQNKLPSIQLELNRLVPMMASPPE